MSFRSFVASMYLSISSKSFFGVTRGIRSYHKVSVSHAWIKDIGEGRRVRPDNRNMVAGASVEARAEAQNDSGNR